MSKKKKPAKKDWSEYENVQEMEYTESTCCYAPVTLMRRKKDNPEGYVEAKCSVCGDECELVGDRD